MSKLQDTLKQKNVEVVLSNRSPRPTHLSNIDELKTNLDTFQPTDLSALLEKAIQIIVDYFENLENVRKIKQESETL